LACVWVCEIGYGGCVVFVWRACGFVKLDMMAVWFLLEAMWPLFGRGGFCLCHTHGLCHTHIISANYTLFVPYIHKYIAMVREYVCSVVLFSFVSRSPPCSFRLCHGLCHAHGLCHTHRLHHTHCLCHTSIHTLHWFVHMGAALCRSRLCHGIRHTVFVCATVSAATTHLPLPLPLPQSKVKW